jgi:hypothetical protein
MTENPSDGAELLRLITEEIKALHKGRGVQASDIYGRLGPHLRELAGGEPVSARQRLIVQLNGCAAQLAPDMRLAVTASLALSGKTKETTQLQGRVDWLADQINREYRTASRRIDAAENLLAEQIATELQRRRGRTPTAPSGWYLAEIRALLRLDTAQPESHEHRQIVSTSVDLREVMAWADVPPNAEQTDPRLNAEILYGGRLARQEHPFGNRFQFVVQLPAPLQPGQGHEYGLISRISGHEQMSSHYLVTPECQCNALDLTVRFHPDHPPRWVRCVAGETVRMYEEPRPLGQLLTPDDAGEVHVRFRNLILYLGYGVQWLP